LVRVGCVGELRRIARPHWKTAERNQEMRTSLDTSPTICLALPAPPALRELGLRDEDLHSLRCAGFVTSMVRGRATRVYVLRYRASGKQKKTYIGPDAAKASEIRAALEQWQQPHRASKQLRSMARAVGQKLRSARLRLAAPLAARGLYFHGQRIRRLRQRANV
jgi:hypothetical protein